MKIYIVLDECPEYAISQYDTIIKLVTIDEKRANELVKKLQKEDRHGVYWVEECETEKEY